jgi:hypothetical protein
VEPSIGIIWMANAEVQIIEDSWPAININFLFILYSNSVLSRQIYLAQPQWCTTGGDIEDRAQHSAEVSRR